MLQLQVDVPAAQIRNTFNSALCCNIALLFDDPVSSDIAIKAGDTTIHAHKSILAAQSPTFKAMFQVGTMSGPADHELRMCMSTQASSISLTCIYIGAINKCQCDY